MELKLSNSNQVAFIDDKFAHLAQRSWRLVKAGTAVYVGWKTRVRGKIVTHYLHRLVMGNPKGMVDHKDGDIFNNYESNLRICTNSQNQMNARKQRPQTSSIYKGVSWNKQRQLWKTYLRKDGVDYHIGYFQNERHAALAYDINALTLFGEFARPNFLDVLVGYS